MPGPSPSSSAPRSLLVPLVKFAVSAALLVFLFSKVDAIRLWNAARHASVTWLAGALALYAVMVLASAWRWGLLLTAQEVRLPFRTLTSSFLVATFFNNFLPSNIGGDVIRIADTAPLARSRTIAAGVVLLDRGIGLLALVLVTMPKILPALLRPLRILHQEWVDERLLRLKTFVEDEERGEQSS